MSDVGSPAGAAAAGSRSPVGATVRALEPLATIVALGVAWEVIARLGVLPALPALSSTVAALVADLQTPAFWVSLAITLEVWLFGLVAVIVVGVPTGLLLGLSSFLYRAMHLTVEFLRTIPIIAALPVLVLLLGITFKLFVVIVFIAALWPILVQSMYGARDTDPVARDTARVYGLSPARQVLTIVLPSSLPYIASGLRLSAVMALVYAIATPLIVGGEGLGALMSSAALGGQYDLLFARVVVSAVVGVLVTAGAVVLEGRVLHWHSSQRRPV